MRNEPTPTILSRSWTRTGDHISDIPEQIQSRVLRTGVVRDQVPAYVLSVFALLEPELTLLTPVRPSVSDAVDER